MTKKESRNLTWKLKDLPTASELADLVERGVLKPEEAREIALGSIESDKGKVDALEKMVEFLQGLVTELSKKQTTTFIPSYEKIIYIDRFAQPYWDRYWANTNKVLMSSGINMNSVAKGHVGISSSSTFNGYSNSGTTGVAMGGQTLSLSVNNKTIS